MAGWLWQVTYPQLASAFLCRMEILWTCNSWWFWEGWDGRICVKHSEWCMVHSNHSVSPLQRSLSPNLSAPSSYVSTLLGPLFILRPSFGFRPMRLIAMIPRVSSEMCEHRWTNLYLINMITAYSIAWLCFWAVCSPDSPPTISPQVEGGGWCWWRRWKKNQGKMGTVK